MTQTTDQELYEQWRDDYALTYEPNYDEHLEADCRAAFLAGMEASRRAQVVPQFSKVAKQKLDYLLEAGEEITGYAIENKDGRRGAIDCHGFVFWWNEAAPAQMPEPYAYLFQHKEAGFTTKVDYAQLEWGFEESNPLWKRVGALYTEHQVRQLLAQRGIK